MHHHQPQQLMDVRDGSGCISALKCGRWAPSTITRKLCHGLLFNGRQYTKRSSAFTDGWASHMVTQNTCIGTAFFCMIQEVRRGESDFSKPDNLLIQASWILKRNPQKADRWAMFVAMYKVHINVWSIGRYPDSIEHFPNSKDYLLFNDAFDL